MRSPAALKGRESAVNLVHYETDIVRANQNCSRHTNKATCKCFQRYAQEKHTRNLQTTNSVQNNDSDVVAPAEFRISENHQPEPFMTRKSLKRKKAAALCIYISHSPQLENWPKNSVDIDSGSIPWPENTSRDSQQRGKGYRKVQETLEHQTYLTRINIRVS